MLARVRPMLEVGVYWACRGAAIACGEFFFVCFGEFIYFVGVLFFLLIINQDFFFFSERFVLFFVLWSCLSSVQIFVF